MTARRLVVLSSILVAGADACDFCSIAAVVDARSTRPGLVLGLSEQFTYFGTLRSGSDAVADPADQHMASSVTQATIGWQFQPSLGIQAIVPYVHRSFRRADGFAIDEGTEQGLGDIAVVATFTPLRWLGHEAAAVATILSGVKTPTGDDDRLAEEADEVEVPGAPPSGVHGHDLALGTGSWDGVIGATGFARWRRWFVDGDLQYLARTEGGHDYRVGDDLTGSLAPGLFVVLRDDATVGLALRVSGEHKVEDTSAGERADDTAMDALYFGPLVTGTWQDRGSADAGIEWPLYQHVTGVQSTPDWRARVAVTARF
jgi:hypothetical protein